MEVLSNSELPIVIYYTVCDANIMIIKKYCNTQMGIQKQTTKNHEFLAKQTRRAAEAYSTAYQSCPFGPPATPSSFKFCISKEK